jgi:5-methylcytosine-specific restriction endonuclease McrA
MTAPSLEAQLEFLTKLQRLFSEGDFTATYKFALLMALTEICVEQGADNADAMVVLHKDIANKFIDLYWQQTAPYGCGLPDTTTGVLVQNNGAQAAVITAISAFRLKNPGVTPITARRSLNFADLVRAVTQTVAAQPINFLQNLGGTTVQFLYERQRGSIRLLPGISYCLRRFQPLVNQLSRAHWIQHVKGNRLNHPFLGGVDDLESFLFETPRQALATIGVELRKLTDNRCFYCGGGVHEVDVDHFIPFAQYPRDLMHNFVLAHPSCNRSKSDTLASKAHLERWRDYADRHADDLSDIGIAAGRTADLQSSLAVTSWSYRLGYSSGAHAWIKGKQYCLIDRSYIDHTLT